MAGVGRRNGDAGGHPGPRGDHRAGRGAGHRQGRGRGLCAGAEPDPARPAGAGDRHVLDDDPIAAAAGRSASRVGRDPGGDGSHVGLLETRLLPAGGPAAGSMAGQRQGRQAPAGPAEDRQARRGVAVQGRRAADAASQFRAAGADPPVARPDPVPAGSGQHPHRGEAPGGEAARGRPDQAVRGRLGHLRGVRAGDAGRADRRRARPSGARPTGPRPDARQDQRAGGGVRRALHRPPRVSAAHHAGPDRRDQRRHRRGRDPDRGADRPFRPGGGPA